MKRFLLVTFFAFLHVCLVHADTSTFVERNHLIIAFDESGNAWRKTDTNVRYYIKEILSNNNEQFCFTNKDYYSIVGFRADCSGAEWDNFVYIKKDPSIDNRSKELAFVQDSTRLYTLLSNSGLWEELSNYSGNYIDSSYSLLSIAKPYILNRIGTIENKPQVNRTFIILITDHQFNGGDFHNELIWFLSKGNYRDRDITINKVLQPCYQVGEEYTFKYIESRQWGYQPYYRYVELFEAYPNQDYLTLPAVIDYSPSIQARREKGKKHSFHLELKKSNKHYDVKKLSLFFRNPNTGTERLVETFADLDSISRDYIIQDEEGLTHNGLTIIRLDAELLIKDGFYNSTLLNSNMINGLEQTINVINEPNAKMLFELFELPDWLWNMVRVSNQQKAAVIVGFLILALVIIFIVTYVLLTKRYKPEKEEVSIKFYD